MSLEKKLQSQLNHARVQSGLNLVEGRRTDVAVGQAEVGMVKDVKEFRSELDSFRFSDAEILEDREVPIGVAWADADVAAGVAELLNWRIRVGNDLREGRGVEPSTGGFGA